MPIELIIQWIVVQAALVVVAMLMGISVVVAYPHVFDLHKQSENGETNGQDEAVPKR